MAEGFARKYGADVLTPFSAGLMPAVGVAALTHQVMGEKNIRLDGQFPKDLRIFVSEAFDVAVNMSGIPIPEMAPRQIDWIVEDPIGKRPEVYRSVVNQIEDLVMRLILELRSAPV
jgi:protein-tyrosine-phosphatase